jgi:formylglycine-generating enzyme required for sulfatase activity
LQQQLGALVSDGRLTPRQRAEAGVTLGWLGDSRPDVVCEIPHMITIPAGPFLMGSDKTVDGQAAGDEQPQHTLSLPAYAIGKYPITVAQYRRFVAAGGYRERAYWTDAGWQQKEKESWTEPAYWQDVRWTIPNHPVVGISWYEAVAYCNWLKATTGREFRLPDEAMWEKAARGTDGRIYSWGNEWNANHLNADETGIGGTTAVGLFPSGQSPFGVLDMSGNVLEWCSGVGYVKVSYPFQRQSYEEDLVASGTRIWRGGAFYFDVRLTRAAYRAYDLPPFRDFLIGFRVAEHLSYPVS